MTERRHLEEEALLDQRQHDLESATGPTVPKTMKGPDAPSASERTAHEITQQRGVKLAYWDVASRRTSRQTHSVGKGQEDDRGADDDLATCLALFDVSPLRQRDKKKGATDYLASSVAGCVKNLFVGRFCVAMRHRNLDHGRGGECEGENA